MTATIPTATTLVLDFLTAVTDRKMSAQRLCEAGSVLGYSEATMRVAITRLVQQGKILKLERGWYSPNAQRNRLQLDVENWRERADWIVPWNGGWIAVHEGAINRQDKTALRQHQRALKLRGFQKWNSGLYLRPDNLQGGVEALRAELAELGVAKGAQLFVATEFDPGQAAELRQLWDIPALRRDYAKMLSRLVASKRRLKKLDLSAAGRESLLVGRELIGQMLRDPLLPAEMVRGQDYRELAQIIAEYQDFSREIWNRVFSGA